MTKPVPKKARKPPLEPADRVQERERILRRFEILKALHKRALGGHAPSMLAILRRKPQPLVAGRKRAKAKAG